MKLIIAFYDYIFKEDELHVFEKYHSKFWNLVSKSFLQLNWGDHELSNFVGSLTINYLIILHFCLFQPNYQLSSSFLLVLVIFWVIDCEFAISWMIFNDFAAVLGHVLIH